MHADPGISWFAVAHKVDISYKVMDVAKPYVMLSQSGENLSSVTNVQIDTVLNN